MLERHLIEERQLMIAQIDQLHFHVSPGLGLLQDPLRRLVGEPGGAGGTDDNADFGRRVHSNLTYAGFSM